MEIVVVGCRGFGKFHLDALSKTDADISIVERQQPAKEWVLENYRIHRVYDSLDDALRSNADIIDLVVPHHLHYPMAVKSLSAGKHVIVEKPIATTNEDATEMIRVSEEMGRKFMVSDQYHFDPAIARIKDSIARNEIGRVHTIIIRGQGLVQFQDWRGVIDSMGGGALIDGGIHYVNSMLNLGGQYHGIISRAYSGSGRSQGEDTSISIFDFKSGARGLLFYSWAYPGRLNAPSYEIVGTDGLILEDIGTRPKSGFKALRGMRAFGDPIVNNRLVQIGEFDVFQAEMQGFIDSIKNDSEVPFPPRLAARDLAAVLEIYGQNSQAL